MREGGRDGVGGCGGWREWGLGRRDEGGGMREKGGGRREEGGGRREEGGGRREEGGGRREEGGGRREGLIKKTDVKSISTTKFLHRVFHNVLIILTDFLL